MNVSWKKELCLLLADGLLLLLAGIYTVLSPLDSNLFQVKYTGTVLLAGSLLRFVIAIRLAEEQAETIWILRESAFDLRRIHTFQYINDFPGLSIISRTMARRFRRIKAIYRIIPAEEIASFLTSYNYGTGVFLFGFILLNGPYRSTGDVSCLFGLFCITPGGLFTADAIYYPNFADIIGYLI